MFRTDTPGSRETLWTDTPGSRETLRIDTPGCKEWSRVSYGTLPAASFHGDLGPCKYVVGQSVAWGTVEVLAWKRGDIWQGLLHRQVLGIWWSLSGCQRLEVRGTQIWAGGELLVIWGVLWGSRSLGM